MQDSKLEMDFINHVQEMFTEPEQTVPYFSNDIVTVSYAFFTSEVEHITVQTVVIKELVVHSQHNQGVGTSILQTITKVADETQIMLTLTPAPLPEQKVEDPQNYRNRLMKFYSKEGFTINPFWKPIGWVDELTGKPWVEDQESQNQFSSEMQQILTDGQFHQLVRPVLGNWFPSWLKVVE